MTPSEREYARDHIAQQVRDFREVAEPGMLVMAPQTLAEIGTDPIEGLTPQADLHLAPGKVYVMAKRMEPEEEPWEDVFRVKFWTRAALICPAPPPVYLAPFNESEEP